MSTTEKPETTGERSPLFGVAYTLSVTSALWTAYSCWDLLDRHPMALVAGATYDILWMSLIYTEWKSKISGRKASAWPGWVMLVPVVVLLTWHGHAAWSTAGAIAGPFLAIGTKVLWRKAIEDSVDEIAIKKGAANQRVSMIEAETDIILKEEGAKIRKDDAQAKARHEAILAEKRRQHELRMADKKYAQAEKKAAIENRTDLILGQVENAGMERIVAALERMIPQPSTIPGEVVPQQVAPQEPRKELTNNPQPAVQAPKEIVTMSLDEDGEILTDAQKNRRRLAALYYLMSDAATDRGEKLSQSAYALRMGEKKAQISRSVNEFPREAIGDIEMYREDLDQLGETG